MDTLPPEWRAGERPALLGSHGTGARRRVSTAWEASPLSAAWDGRARADRRVRRCLDRIASEWNRVVHRGPLARFWPSHPAPVRFPLVECRLVASVAATVVLERELTHIASLCSRHGPGCGLHAVAMLERLETVVAQELELRHAGLT